jgi:hypothetical protein
MRNFCIPLVLSVLGLVGCGYDPVAVCESRCEQEKARDCDPLPGIECDSRCSVADDTYEMGLDRARDTGCVGEYQNYTSCLDHVPICATLTDIAAMCAEEYIALASCEG